MPVHAPGEPEPRGLQLWVDLPKKVRALARQSEDDYLLVYVKFKMVDPSYQELGPEGYVYLTPWP